MDQTSETAIITGLYAVVNLDIFVLHYPCPNIITATVGTCTQLKILNVSFSCCVTDVTIGDIIKLQYFEEVNT
jgi:hypothetical protein